MNNRKTHILLIVSVVINVFLCGWIYHAKSKYNRSIEYIKQNHAFWKRIDKMRTDFELKMCQDNYDWQLKIFQDRIEYYQSLISPETKKKERDRAIKVSEYLKKHPLLWWH